jgi:UDP-N-acetylmuramoyl-L-alanyl-D-glutamate--2,6-diaminopimelate ligase
MQSLAPISEVFMSDKGSKEAKLTIKPKKLKSFLPFELSDHQKKMEVSNLQVDSRKVQQGDLFIAYPGVSADGRRFVKQASEQGAACVLAETATNDEEYAWLEGLGCEVVQAKNIQQQLGDIASAFYGKPSKKMDVVAVTGTNGKTSVTQLIAQALMSLGKKSAVLGTLGNGVLGELDITNNTTPGAVDLHKQLNEFVGKDVQLVAMEASSHGLDQGRLNGAAIDAAIVTNLSRDHLDYHGSMKAYQKAKEILVAWPGLEKLILNADDLRVKGMAKHASETADVLYFSMNDCQADVYASDIEYSHQGLRFALNYKGNQQVVESHLIGEFNVSNLLAVCSYLLVSGYSLDQVAGVLPTLKTICGRMDMVVDAESASLPVVVVDYAHTPDALEKAISAVRRHCEGALWCVFGCGGDRDVGKRSMMGEVASKLADRIVLTNDNPRSENAEAIFNNIEEGFESSTDYFVQKDRKEAIYDAVDQADVNDWILVAGKGHEDYQEINGVKYPFSDLKVAKKALKKRRLELESSCS